MKKTLIAMLVLLMAASAFAVNPVGKGMLYMDGTMTANFAKSSGDLYKDANDDTPTYIQIAPSMGYFFADGLAIGATVMFDKWSQGDYSSTGFHFGPRVMWFPTAKKADEPKGKLLPFVAASFLLTSDKTEYPEDILAKSTVAAATTTYKTSGYEARFAGGGVWMLSNSLGLHGEAYFALQNEKVKEPVEGDGVSGSEFGILIGVVGFFGGK